MKCLPPTLLARWPSGLPLLSTATLALLLMPALAQGPGNRVLILNSDQSVQRYSEVQAAFKDALGAPTVDVDLASRPLSEPQLERMLRDESAGTIYCIGSKAYLLASRVARERMIVMSSAINWQRLPTRQNNRIVATELPAEAQLTLFRYFFPGVRRIGIMYSPEFNREWIREARAAAEHVGIELVTEQVRRTSGVSGDLNRLLPRVDALWLAADPVVLGDEATVRDSFRQCRAASKPVFTYSTAYSALGATLMISPDVPTMGRQAAGLATGAGGPDATPLSQSPAGSEITLNLRMVKELGLSFNDEAMDSVNTVIR